MSQDVHDPDCYCAAKGLGFSCAASAGELCEQVDGHLAADLDAIQRAAENIDPSIDVLAELMKRDRDA